MVPKFHHVVPLNSWVVISRVVFFCVVLVLGFTIFWFILFDVRICVSFVRFVRSWACRSGRVLRGLGGLGLGLGGLLRLLPLLLFRRQGLELEGVDAALASHLLAEEGVDHAVAGGLHLGAEGLGDDDESVGTSGVRYARLSIEKKDGRSYLKWVSLEVLPTMALWWLWRWESL